MTMNRRTFLGLSGGVAASGLFGGLALPRNAAALHSFARQSSGTARTLVVVDLQGGNDALNTFVPQSGLYRDLRPTIALPESDLLTFAGLEYGVHPSLASLQSLWDNGQLAALYGTGLQGQGRSHFVAKTHGAPPDPANPPGLDGLAGGSRQLNLTRRCRYGPSLLAKARWPRRVNKVVR